LGQTDRIISTREGLTITDNSEDKPAIRREILARLRLIEVSSGGGLLDELIDLFLQDTPKRIGYLEHAIIQGSAAAVASAAHALRNNAGHFGADRMCELCDEIEEQALDGQAQFPRSLLSELLRECDRVQRALIAEKTKQ
jgi:HPt (histidine-containing phosphotransfer) domain-containing protein